jgi:flagellar biosynthesis protein FliR
MTWLLSQYWTLFLVFTLVLARVGGLVMTAPVFGTGEIPLQVRALLAVALAALVSPLETLQVAHPPQGIADYALLIGGESLLGVTIGMGIRLMFSGLHLAGQVVAQMSGVQWTDVVNPQLDAEVPVFSQLLFFVALGVFVLMDGHRMVMTALLDTFVLLPPGGARMPATFGETLNALVNQSLTLGVRAAAPAALALLMSTLLVGLIGRTIPQINTLNFGFALNSLVTIAAIGLSLGAVAWMVHDQAEQTLKQLLEMWRG